MGHAVGLHRTVAALRTAAHAHRGPQVHQPLGIRFDACATGQQGLRKVPQGPQPRRSGHILPKGAVASQDALDVAVQNRHALARRKGGNRSGRRPADARQALQHSCIGWEPSAMARQHGLRAGVQVARTAVVAQAAPQGQHLLHPRIRQVCHRGKALKESAVVAQHGRHLGLLQHDLRQPDTVGVTGALPGQAVASIPVLPGHHALSKVLSTCAAVSQGTHRL